jgi:hypothetical protein
MSSIPSLVGCQLTLDLGDVLVLVSKVGALPTEGAEPCEDRTYGVLQSAGRTW